VAQDKPQPGTKPDQIKNEYVAPMDTDLTPIYQRVKDAKILERFQAFLAPLMLPEPLLLRFQDCDGDANAWYKEGSVTICYEYLAEQLENAPRRKTVAGVTPQDAFIGPGVEVVLHEVGHAVFHMLDIPIFGRVEDAADQFASFILIRMGKEEARRTIGGTALMYVRDAKEEKQAAKKESKGMKAFSNEHGLAAQRFYNILCLAYGAYPDVFQDVVDKGYLPKGRSARCAKEYRQVTNAFDRLIRPHLDKAMLEEVRHRQWLAPASSN
jgi:hypothetical protein